MIRITMVIILLSLITLPVLYILHTDEEKSEVVEPMYFVTRGETTFRMAPDPEMDSLVFYLKELRTEIDSLKTLIEE